MTQVFISYSREDLDFIKQLAADLRAARLDVWYDLSRLKVGDSWTEKIQFAIDSSDTFIIVISPDSIASRWVRKEFLYASDAKKKIVPLLYKNCKLPLWLLDIQYLDVQGSKYKRNLNEILYTLDQKLGDGPNHRLKELESKAIQHELKGDFWNALDCWYEIKRIDPSFSRVNIKIEELEGELRREKEERKRKALQEKEEREAVREKVKREKAERRAAHWAALAKIPSAAIVNLKNVARLILAKLQNKILLSILALLFFGAVIGYALTIQGSALPLYFSGDTGGEVNIYAYKGDRITKITQTTAGAKNWSPANGVGGNVYFTSNRSGKAEIYGFNTNKGGLWQITVTPGGYESWSPAIGIDGNIYFTSNRSGKAEIYGFDTNKGSLWQITATPGGYESWSPAIGVGGIIYFTSNRTGKAEIYRFNTNSGELKQITDTPGGAESWSPAISFGNLYFTSNRTGKAEVYKFNTNTGELQQITDTPGQSESWAPVVLGNKIFITSNRSGQTRVFLLNHEEVSISDFTSWTKKINNRVPGY